MSAALFYLLSILRDGQVLQRSGRKIIGVDPGALAPAGDFEPAATDAYDLGETTTPKRWRFGHFSRGLVVTHAATASGIRTALTVTGAADLARTASTAQPDVLFNGARTVTWATGAIVYQSMVEIRAQTLAAAAASVVDDAATVDIDNATQAGANVTITRPWALRVRAGATRLGGAVSMGSTLAVAGVATFAVPATSTVDNAATDDVRSGFTVRRTVTGTNGAAGVGVRLDLSAPSTTGVERVAGGVEAALTTATNGAEVGRASLVALAGGALVEGVRVQGVASAVQRVLVRPGATGVPVALVAEGENGAGLDFAANPLGTPGSIRFRNPGETATIFGVQPAVSGNQGLTVSLTATTAAGPTIHKPAGQVSIQAGSDNIVVTNDLVTAASVILCQLQFVDATLTQILSVVPGAGSFTITGNANATALTKVCFLVLNPST